MRSISSTIIIAIIVWAGGLFGFSKYIDSFDNEKSGFGKVDAIVALTGSNVRIKESLNLLRDGNAEKLFISGAGKGVKIEEIAQITNFDLSSIPDYKYKVQIGYEANDTRGNALEVNNWLEKNSFEKIILVTSDYHMPRSINEIRNQIKDIKIIPYPVKSSFNSRKNKWKQTVAEYHKFFVSKVNSIF